MYEGDIINIQLRDSKPLWRARGERIETLASTFVAFLPSQPNNRWAFSPRFHPLFHSTAVLMEVWRVSLNKHFHRRRERVALKHEKKLWVGAKWNLITTHRGGIVVYSLINENWNFFLPSIMKVSWLGLSRGIWSGFGLFWDSRR